MKSIPHPNTGDYKSYYGLYIDKVIGEDIYHTLKRNSYAVPASLYDIPADKWHYRYDEVSWCLADLGTHPKIIRLLSQ